MLKRNDLLRCAAIVIVTTGFVALAGVAFASGGSPAPTVPANSWPVGPTNVCPGGSVTIVSANGSRRCACPPGDVLTMDHGARVCDMPAPRSAADCPPGAVFRVISGRGACQPIGGLPGPGPRMTDEYPVPFRCGPNSFCPKGYSCNKYDYCAP